MNENVNNNKKNEELFHSNLRIHKEITMEATQEV